MLHTIGQTIERVNSNFSYNKDMWQRRNMEMPSKVTTPHRSNAASRYLPFAGLSSNERELLAVIEKDPREYPRDHVLAPAGADADRLFMLKEGWACGMRTLADGQRQLLDVFLPGQIMGLREMSFSNNLSEFRTLTPVVVCSFPRQQLSEMFAASPRLAALFFTTAACEQSMLMERIVSIGRRTAAARLAHFIIEMRTRLNAGAREFELPLSQTAIGDALGLTSVHVSRTFSLLKELKLVERRHGSIHIKDLDRLIEFSGFDGEYLDRSPNWPNGVSVTSTTRH